MVTPSIDKIEVDALHSSAETRDDQRGIASDQLVDLRVGEGGSGGGSRFHRQMQSGPVAAQDIVMVSRIKTESEAPGTPTATLSSGENASFHPRLIKL